MDSKSILNCSSSLIYESYKIENSDKRNIENTANSDLTMKKSSFGDARPSQFKLLTYVAPIIEVKKPKNLNGPFDTLDIQNIRQAIQKRLKNNCYRKKQEEKLSHEFVDVMNLNEYFEKKNNWIDKSKFVNTYSLYKSMNTYLPGYNMSFTKLPVQPETFGRDIFSIKKPIINEKKYRNYFESESKIISNTGSGWL